MNDFLTWDILTTYSGVILAVTIITQFIKDVGFIAKVPTRITAYFVSIIVMILALLFTGSFTWSAFALTFINAIFVALAANGAFDACNEINNSLKPIDEGYIED